MTKTRKMIENLFDDVENARCCSLRECSFGDDCSKCYHEKLKVLLDCYELEVSNITTERM